MIIKLYREIHNENGCKHFEKTNQFVTDSQDIPREGERISFDSKLYYVQSITYELDPYEVIVTAIAKLKAK